MKKTATLLIALAIVLGLASCQPKETKLYIATINDMHANIDNFPKLAYVLDSLRAVYPDMLLFSSGDNRSGNPINDRCELPSRPMYELMNAVGFNLSTFGNHEWDSGVEALRDLLNLANFPFVSANVSFDDSLQMPVSPYVIIERNGLKIGVLGAIQLGLNGLPDFHPDYAPGSHFIPAEEALPQYMWLRDTCNALFLLSHNGFEEDIELAQKFPQFDAIFGGHSHTLVDSTRIFNGVMVTQAMNKVKYLTFNTFTFDKDGKMIAKESQVIPISKVKNVNEKVKAMVDQYNNNETFKKVLGYNDAEINDCYECLGSLMADSHRAMADADMAFQNYGGVRFDTLGVRPITLKDLLSLDPFDNSLIVINMTGQEIIDFLGVSFFTDGGPNYCSGCTYTYSVDENGQMKDCQVKLDNGKPLDLKKTYKVVMNSYMASKFDFPHEDPGTDIFRTSNEAIVKYLDDNQHVNYAKAFRVHEK
ncbi:MAG: 5'-nucleotidase C-terminal domain-containing protein [Bacteroidales bacterium]|nr:5'-nucleotidase C-terminal domain-containing protein [Bacteroidales bacterium]